MDAVLFVCRRLGLERPTHFSPYLPWPVDQLRAPVKFIFVSEVLKFIEQRACDLGTEGKDFYWDIRTLRKYATPHLETVGVQLLLSHNASYRPGRGHFYCNPSACIAMVVTTEAESTEGSKSIDEYTREMEREDLEKLSNLFRQTSTTEAIITGSWEIDEFIRAVEPRLWLWHARRLAPNAMVAEAKNVARAFGDSWTDQFPFNNTIAPPLRFLQMNIRRLSRPLYFELETRAQTADTRRSTSGPLLTSVGITAMYAMSDSMHRNLARFGAVASVEVARRLQRMFAAKRAAAPREAYDELPAGGLDVISMDIINVRDKHGVLTVARGEKGFDGIAVQGVGWLDGRFTDRDKKDPYRQLPRIYRSVSDIERPERKALMDSFLV